MRTIGGLILLAVSFTGTLYFRSYNGIIISHPMLWYLLFILIGIIGLLLVYSGFNKVTSIIEEHENTVNDAFKLSAERVEIDFDKCVFKNGSYTRQTESEYNSVTETLEQSYFIYTDTLHGEPRKFISPSFPFEETTLKFHVLNKGINLYVNKFDRARYLFELKK